MAPRVDVDSETRVRAASEADWSHVRELLASVPMSASLPFTVRRSEDHQLAYPRLRGTPIELIAVRGAELVGYVHGLVAERLLWDGRCLVPRQVLYAGDLRVAPGRRRAGVARRLLGAMTEEARHLDTEVACALVNEGNAAAVGLLAAAGGRHVAVRTFTTAARLLLRRPGRRPGRLVPCALDDAMLDGLIARHKARLLAPSCDRADLLRLGARHPELTFLRAPPATDRVFAIWDQRRVRQLVATRLPPLLRTLGIAWRRLARWTGAHRFPAVSDSLRTVEVTFDSGARVTEHEEDLVALAHAGGAHLLNVIESGLDPQLAPARLRGPSVRLRSTLLAVGLGGRSLPEFPPHLPVHVDLAFV
jgi:GNAT superfamily N-acetyltransferase